MATWVEDTDEEVIVIDTPELKPYRGAETHVFLPVTPAGVFVREAALADALEQVRSGNRILFIADTVFDVRVIERMALDMNVKCTVAHSKLKEEALIDFLREFENGRRDENACEGSDDVVSAFALFGITPVFTSGVSSLRLFDAVVASITGLSISARIAMQMVQRARPPKTKVRIFLTDASIVRVPGGRWECVHVDFNAAAPDVMQHCRERALVEAGSKTAAARLLRLADLRQAFSDEPGTLRVGIEKEAVRDVAIDDDAFYAHVSDRKGTAWLRFSRAPYPQAPTFEDVYKEVCKRERLSQVALMYSPRRVGEMLSHMDTVEYNKLCSLKCIEAQVELDKKLQKQNFLPVLSAIIRREERSYTGARLYFLTDEEIALTRRIADIRKEMKEADLVAFCLYEAKKLRPINAGNGTYGCKEERYEAHVRALADQNKQTSWGIITGLLERESRAKRARVESRAEDGGNDDGGDEAQVREIDEPEDDDADDERAPRSDDGSDDDSRGQDDADEEDEYTLPKWLADAVKGDSCMLAWGAYLTYGVEATGKLVDSFLKLHDERKRLLADSGDVPKTLKEGT